MSDDQARVAAFIEHVTGCRVTRIERQARWRPAWFADVEKDGKVFGVHARGDRQSDIMPFPDLRREAEIMMELEVQGVPVPHIYGYCADPPAIIMETIAGTRDMAQAASDAERRSITREYIEAVAKMHRAPIDGFVTRGLHRPEGAEAIALEGLNAYFPLYRKVRARPEPLIEFAIGWIRHNVPMHRTRACFTQYDSGQFLFADGRLTGLYDFEFGMIGDPMADLATMRMRDSVEPLGDEMRNLYRHYEAVSGEPVDDAALLYHNVVFATVAPMQICGALATPKPGDPHATYIEWDLALRRVLVKVLAEAMGVTVEMPAPPVLTDRPQPEFAMLRDSIAAIPAETDVAAMQKESAARMAEYLAQRAAHGAAFDAQTDDERAELLGVRHADRGEADAALEAFVLQAGRPDDERLLRFFTRAVERDVVLYGATAIGAAARKVHLPPLR